MLYCKKCMALSQTDKCEKCGSSKLVVPLENDPVYLVNKDPMWAGVACDVLKTNEIPYIKKSFLGEGLAFQVGYYLENYDIYVPYGLYEEAKELLSEIFAEEEQE